MNNCKDCTKWIPDSNGEMGTCTAHVLTTRCSGPRPIATHAMDGCVTRFSSSIARDAQNIDAALNSLEAFCSSLSAASA